MIRERQRYVGDLRESISKAHRTERLAGDNNSVSLCETLDLFRAIFHIDRTTSEFVFFVRQNDRLPVNSRRQKSQVLRPLSNKKRKEK